MANRITRYRFSNPNSFPQTYQKSIANMVNNNEPDTSSVHQPSLEMTPGLSPNNTPYETPIYTPLETPMQSPTEQTHNVWQDHRPQTPDYHRFSNNTEDMNDSTAIQHESKKPESEEVMANSSFSASNSNNIAAPSSPERASSEHESSPSSRKSSSHSSQTESEYHPNHYVEPEKEDDQREAVPRICCRKLAVASSSLQTIKPPHNKDPSRVRYIDQRR